mmetsp:Transcript_33136/g.53528  ORF Transcript_33136/g.53528 Transcript_33136/m.53528 type:complete len:87 (-) Transcript_33136:115-375(-)
MHQDIGSSCVPCCDNATMMPKGKWIFKSASQERREPTKISRWKEARSCVFVFNLENLQYNVQILAFFVPRVVEDEGIATEHERDQS